MKVWIWFAGTLWFLQIYGGHIPGIEIIAVFIAAAWCPFTTDGLEFSGYGLAAISKRGKLGSSIGFRAEV